MALPVTDAFTSGSTLGLAAYGAYEVLEGALSVIGGTPGVAVSSGAYNTARRTDETFGAAQFSRVVITAAQIANGIYAGPAVRCQSGANTSYHVETNGSNYYLSKCLAGTQTSPAGPVTLSFAAGDVLGLEVEEVAGTTTLRVYKALAASPTSFTLDATYTDTSGPITTAGTAGIFAYGNSSTTPVIGTWTTGNLAGAPAPTITSTSSATPANGSSLTITGTGFGATQGAGGVTIGGVAQAVTGWSDTSITVTVARGTNQYGAAVNVVVTDNASASSSPYALTSLQPQSGWSFVNVGTPNPAPDLRLSTSPDIVSGDQIAWDTKSALVTVAATGEVTADGAVYSFAFEVWSTGSGWGTQGLYYPMSPRILATRDSSSLRARRQRLKRSTHRLLDVRTWGGASLGLGKWLADELSDTASSASVSVGASLSVAVQAAQTAASSLGAAVQAARTASASAGLAVQAPHTASASTDVAIQSPRTATAALGLAAQASVTANVSIGTAVQVSSAATASLGAVVQQANTATASLSAAVQASQTATAGISAFVQAGSAVSSSLDLAVQAARTATASADAAVQVARTATASVGAAVQAAQTATAGLSLQVQAGTAVFASLDTAVRAARSASASLDVPVSTGRTAALSLGAVVGSQPIIVVGLDLAALGMRTASCSMGLYVEDPLAGVTNPSAPPKRRRSIAVRGRNVNQGMR